MKPGKAPDSAAHARNSSPICDVARQSLATNVPSLLRWGSARRELQAHFRPVCRSRALAQIFVDIQPPDRKCPQASTAKALRASALNAEPAPLFRSAAESFDRTGY